MNIVHVVPGLHENCNGISVAVQLIAGGQRGEGLTVDLVDAAVFSASTPALATADEVWVHSMWTCRLVWKACRIVIGEKAKGRHVKLVRMTHANLDPLRYRYHGLRKRLASPVERLLFSKTDRVAVTGDFEEKWCRDWGLDNEFQIVDLKRFFKIHDVAASPYWEVADHEPKRPARVLYLGRNHPLKGLSFLKQAVSESNVDLRIESGLSGEEKEKAWRWADVLCLPTLSENFGLVVAEALERGLPVITTDGAPAWKELAPAQGWYLKGYRDGSDVTRIELLKRALSEFVCQRHVAIAAV